MAYDVFNGGVDLTGLHDASLIKLLVCYITDTIKMPVDKVTVATALQRCGIANYFDTLEAYGELRQKGLISEQNGVYYIEEKGKSVLNELKNELPLTVKEKSVSCIKNLAEDQRRKEENKVEITKQGDGVNVRCCVSQQDCRLIDLNLYMPNNENACVIRDVFQKNAPDIYSIIIAASIGDCDMLTSAVENYKNKLKNDKNM